jgi:hypothetical protein
MNIQQKRDRIHVLQKVRFEQEVVRLPHLHHPSLR